MFGSHFRGFSLKTCKKHYIKNMHYRPKYICNQFKTPWKHSQNDDMHIMSKLHMRQSRRGYLGSTLLVCRAVALPHIKLEICIKLFSVE